jgi:hypothetical protein
MTDTPKPSETPEEIIKRLVYIGEYSLAGSEAAFAQSNIALAVQMIRDLTKRLETAERQLRKAGDDYHAEYRAQLAEDIRAHDAERTAALTTKEKPTV